MVKGYNMKSKNAKDNKSVKNVKSTKTAKNSKNNKNDVNNANSNNVKTDDKLKCFDVIQNETIDKHFINLFNGTIPKYSIIFVNDNIVTTNLKQNFTLLKYSNNEDKQKIDDLLFSIYYSFLNSTHSNIYKMPNEIECSVLYIFLLPLLTTSNEYIIKPGYSSDLAKRKSDLMKEFNINEIYLFYAMQLKCEIIENKMHSILKTFENVKYYPIKKKNNVICNETYIFNYSTFKDIINITNKLSMNSQINELNKNTYQQQIKKIELDIQKSKEAIEIQKSNEAIEIQKSNEAIQIQKSNEAIQIQKSNEAIQIQKSNEAIQIQKSNEEIEKTKLEIVKLKLKAMELFANNPNIPNLFIEK